MKLSGFFIFLVVAGIYLLAKYPQPDTYLFTEFAIEKSAERTIASKTKKEVFYKCTRGKEMRWMRLYYQGNGKCKTVYSKGGDAKEVSTSTNYETCENVLNNIRKNLEEGAYSCEEKILMGALELE